MEEEKFYKFFVDLGVDLWEVEYFLKVEFEKNGEVIYILEMSV